MPHITADRVRDTSTSTGTGAFTVTGNAPAGYRTFSAVCAANDTLFYANATYAAVAGGGSKTLSAVLDRVRVLSSGTNTFDAGTVNLIYEG